MSDLPPISASTAVPPTSDQIRTNTLAFVYETVSQAFEAQNDLDESVWRTMPFIAALFALAVTVIRAVPAHMPLLGSAAEWVAGIAYLLSIAAFAVAFIYFWQVAMPRFFEYPSTSTDFRDHAVATTLWYESQPIPGKTIDDKVRDDLRRLMIDQLSNATEANRVVVEIRLAARSRTILLLLAGFAFISFSDVIFLDNAIQSFGALDHANRN